MGQTAVAGDKQHGVTFILAGAEKNSDGMVNQGRRWAKAIKAAVAKTFPGQGEGVQVVSSLKVTAAEIAQQIRDASDAQAKHALLGINALDAHLGGLRQLCLVLVAHGLDGPDGQPDTGGLLLFRRKPGTHVELMRAHLDHMVLKDGQIAADEDKLKEPAGEDEQGEFFHPEPFKQATRDFTAVVQALRDSTFDYVYLAACGGSSSPADTAPPPKIVGFAFRLATLTKKVVFFNRQAIFITTGAKPFVEVGFQKLDGTIRRSFGTAFFEMEFDELSGDDRPKSVELITTPDTFLRGSVGRAPQRKTP